MTKGLKMTVACLLFIVILLPLFTVLSFAQEEASLISDFNSLMTAVKNANNGDILLVGDIDFSPLSPDVPNSMMQIAVEKSITLKSGKTEGAAVFLNGGFVLAGSKLTDEKITVRFENIIFDGKADYDNLTEADYEHPWSEAEQVETYNASLKAQQALSFMGNVDADFSGCVFRNYMHEYGPVIDIRYADYTGNDYISLPDYSACSLNLNFADCRFERNSALYDGGAIYIEANKNVVLNADNCVFSGNRSTIGDFSRGGGVVWASGAVLNFTDCILENNIANYAFSDSVLSEYDTHKGGALCLEACKLSFVNGIFRDNCASLGGAISMTNTQADIDGCQFIANRAEHNSANPDGLSGPWSNMGMGGAFYTEGNSNDTITLVNCELKDNFASNAYGGIYGFYVSFEDPSLPAYNIKMMLCTYEGNRDGVDYDYSTVGDLAWMSHPGDMFTNPHLTLFGCYIVDETFDKDFPHNDVPSADNGYNYLSAKPSEEMSSFVIPKEEAEKMLVDRYGNKLNEIYIGSNYTEALYKAEEATTAEEEVEGLEEASLSTEETEIPVSEAVPPGTDTLTPAPESDFQFPWIVWVAVFIAVGGAMLAALMRKKTTHAAEPAGKTASAESVHDSTVIIEKPTVIKTRYEDTEIDRFISLVPETDALTNRELEVLREMLRGKKQGEIAYYLGIAVTTVKDFYRKIYTKLNVENKDGLFLMADEVLKKK